MHIIEVRKVGKVWCLFVDNDMHYYGLLDRSAAEALVPVVEVEIECRESADRLQVQSIIRGASPVSVLDQLGLVTTLISAVGYISFIRAFAKRTN